MSATNKIALVTGGSRGLGKNMAIAIATKGIDVIITYNSQKEEAESVVTTIQQLGRKAACLQLNVADAKTYEGFFKQLSGVLASIFNAPKINALINNAGIAVHAAFADTTEEDFDNLVDTHFKAAFFLTQKALPVLEDGSSIVNISTGLARFATPGYAAYASMKGAIETLSRYQAKELGAKGIRVNTVAPGAIETDFGGGVVRDNQELNKYIASQTALGRVGLPDDIGGVVAFLCTDDARWITGQRIEVSGGMYI